MIPIGAPVTVTCHGGKKLNGFVQIVYQNELKGNLEVIDNLTGYGFMAHSSKVKIRIDNPAPFTLWQQQAIDRMRCVNPLGMVMRSNGQWLPFDTRFTIPK